VFVESIEVDVLLAMGCSECGVTSLADFDIRKERSGSSADCELQS
jgi:hypothetical protein